MEKPKMENATYLNFAGFQCLEDLNHSTIDLYLSTCGIQNCVAGHFFGPGKREEYILHFISDGKGSFTCGGHTYHLSRGDVFLIKPNTEVYYVADFANPWSYLWVGFNGIKAPAYLAYAGLEGDTITCRCENTPLVFSYIQQMIICRHLTHSNELKRQAALLQVLSVLIDEYRARLPKEERYDYPYKIYVEQAIDYIQRNYKSDVKINDIAGYVGIDRSYLTNIFKTVTNLSPQEYLLRYRMEQAKVLLSQTEKKVGEIALQIGYSDPMAFSKMFKKHTGISPTEFREQEK
jgi:AraC-type DNA-binding domain-containing proteins